MKSHDLSNEKAEGVTYKETEDAFVIVLDPNWNTSEDEALDYNEARVVSCRHLGRKEPDRAHGPRFQECMKRFETEK